MLEKLYLPSNLDLYKFYYQPLINNRVEEIIVTAWKDVVQQIHIEIKDLLKIEHRQNTQLKTYLWTEDQLDIPLSLKQALSSDKQHHKLLLKTKGYTPGIVAVCQSLDDKMKILFDDLKLYLSGSNSSSGADVKQFGSGVPDDLEPMVAFLRTSSREGILE